MGLQSSPERYVPVGQESPTRGMGVWAMAGRAGSMIEQSRYLVMVISPGWCVVSICEVEEFWFGARKIENMPSGIVPKSPKSNFGPFGAIDVGVIWGFCAVPGMVRSEVLININGTFSFKRLLPLLRHSNSSRFFTQLAFM